MWFFALAAILIDIFDKLNPNLSIRGRDEENESRRGLHLNNKPLVRIEECHFLISGID